MLIRLLPVGDADRRRACNRARHRGGAGTGPGSGRRVQLKLAPIPPGKFLMGSSDEQRKAIIKALADAGLAEARAAEFVKDESPQHEVTISKPFHMGITHVTVDQFAAFVKDTGYKTAAERAGGSFNIDIGQGKLQARPVRGASWRKPGFEQKGDHPVVHVDWNDAQAFCAWLSKKSGHTVRLPTEAQWEYACRAGSNTIYAWANCADQTLKKKMDATPAFAFFAWDDGFVYTSPVASFKAKACRVVFKIAHLLASRPVIESTGGLAFSPHRQTPWGLYPPNPPKLIALTRIFHSGMRKCRWDAISAFKICPWTPTSLMNRRDSALSPQFSHFEVILPHLVSTPLPWSILR